MVSPTRATVKRMILRGLDGGGGSPRKSHVEAQVVVSRMRRAMLEMACQSVHPRYATNRQLFSESVDSGEPHFFCNFESRRYRDGKMNKG